MVIYTYNTSNFIKKIMIQININLIYINLIWL